MANAPDHPWHDSVVPGRNSKLTASQRDEISRRKAEGEKTKDLAAEYGVSTSTIKNQG